jgi:hypothetical protein
MAESLRPPPPQALMSKKKKPQLVGDIGRVAQQRTGMTAEQIGPRPPDASPAASAYASAAASTAASTAASSSMPSAASSASMSSIPSTMPSVRSASPQGTRAATPSLSEIDDFEFPYAFASGGTFPGAAASTSAPASAPTSAPAPATSAPATSAPATSAPATSAPATSAPATSAPATSAPASFADGARDPQTGEVQFSFDPHRELRERLERAEIESLMVSRAAREDAERALREQGAMQSELRRARAEVADVDAQVLQMAVEQNVLREEVGATEEVAAVAAAEAVDANEESEMAEARRVAAEQLARENAEETARVRAEAAQELSNLRQQAARDAYAAAQSANEQSEIVTQLQTAARQRDRDIANAAVDKLVLERDEMRENRDAVLASREELRQRAEETYDRLMQAQSGRERQTFMLNAARSQLVEARAGAEQLRAQAEETVQQRDDAIASSAQTIARLEHVIDEQTKNRNDMVENEIARRQAEERELQRLREQLLGKRPLDALQPAHRSAGTSMEPLRMVPEARVALRMQPPLRMTAQTPLRMQSEEEEERRKRQR